MIKNKQINLISEERRTQDLLSVAKMLKPLATKLLGKNGFTEVDLLTNWHEIAGDIAEYTLPKYISFQKNKRIDGVLNVEVPSGAFALELQHREKFIIAKINAFFGYNAVARIKILQNAEIQLQDVDDVRNNQKMLVTEEEENYIKELSDGICNKELQIQLERLGKHIINSNKG